MRILPGPLCRLEGGVRWTARVLTGLLLGLVLVPFVVNGIYDVVHGFYEDGLPHAFWPQLVQVNLVLLLVPPLGPGRCADCRFSFHPLEFAESHRERPVGNDVV